MQEQYRWSFSQVGRFHPAFCEHFVLATYATRPTMVLVTHASALAVILLAFLLRRFIQMHASPRDTCQMTMYGHDPVNRC
jgi:hypothetical protein